jgi:type VI secretion system secreted protein VgrG
MAEWASPTTSSRSAREAVTGRQSYFLEVLGPANAVALSVVSFTAVERLGEPYRITLALTHPEALRLSDYLGREAYFTIELADGSVARKFCGYITQFSQTQTTRDFTAYRFVVEPQIARLRLTRATRIYQNRTAPQIIEQILRRHDMRGHQFTFKLRRQYPQHRFRMQY